MNRQLQKPPPEKSIISSSSNSPCSSAEVGSVSKADLKRSDPAAGTGEAERRAAAAFLRAKFALAKAKGVENIVVGELAKR